ncbi:hypothetical protein Hanom_Chr03g00228941 [Helianthus anomalus]
MICCVYICSVLCHFTQSFRGVKYVILHSHLEFQPKNTLLVQHLLVQSLLPIQTSYSFSTYWFRCCQTTPKSSSPPPTSTHLLISDQTQKYP